MNTPVIPVEHLMGELTLEMGGQKRTLFFDYIFLELLQGFKTEEEFMEFVNQNPHRFVSTLAYYALLAGKEENNLPEDFSEQTVLRWLRGVDASAQQSIIVLWKHSMGFMSLVFAPVLEAGKQEAAKSDKSKKINWGELLTLAFEIGLKPAEFWRSTPLLFSRMVKGYYARQDKEWSRTREILADMRNLLRSSENDPVVLGSDIYPLDSDPPKPKRKIKKLIWSQEEISRIEDLYNRN